MKRSKFMEPQMVFRFEPAVHGGQPPSISTQVCFRNAKDLDFIRRAFGVDISVNALLDAGKKIKQA
jgi:hypothetical protein